MNQRSQPNSPEFVAIATILMATVALSIDIMLPAVGAISADLDASGNQRQFIIVALFVGLAGGQLVFGPLSDSIGRRPAIAIGTLLFAMGGVLCAIATTFETLIAGRVLQGFGAAGPRIVTVALIRDRFAGPAMARIMSIIMGVFILVPVLAPSLGMFLLLIMPWNGLFLLLSVICLAGTTWLFARQPETLAAKRPFRLAAFLRDSRDVVGNRRAMAFTIAGGLCYGALMGYINSSQQVFQEAYVVGELYAIIFGLAALFISIATITNSLLVVRCTMDHVCIGAVICLIVWSMISTGVVVHSAGLPSLAVFMALNCPALFLLGLTFGNFSAIALEELGYIAGTAAAITASLQTLIGVTVAATIGLNYDGTLYPIFVGYTACGAIALGLMLSPSARSLIGRA